MRLLNVYTLELKTFYNRWKRPRYAILSHTWGENEITFEDIKNLSNVRTLPGFYKVESCCRIAREHKLDWVWIDTCCIDKSSSAELSEAINSMFKWYAEAGICYAHLADVDFIQRPNGDKPFDEQAFARSRWFTRGWTLQELIAPQHMVFYSSDWRMISLRAELVAVISSITGIDENIFGIFGSSLQRCSIAQKMSWASRRETEREEDMAYCLMGLFEVNMPLLYGEGGERAFVRLQEEILRKSEDHTLFLWKRPPHQRWHSGLLADSPEHFRTTGSYHSTGVHRDTHEITNLGLRISLPLIFRDPKDPYLGYIGILGVRAPESPGFGINGGNVRIGIHLIPDSHHKGDNRRLMRSDPLELLKLHVEDARGNGSELARVIDGQTGLSSDQFQHTRLVSIYVDQDLQYFVPERRHREELLFQPMVSSSLSSSILVKRYGFSVLRSGTSSL